MELSSPPKKQRKKKTPFFSSEISPEDKLRRLKDEVQGLFASKEASREGDLCGKVESKLQEAALLFDILEQNGLANFLAQLVQSYP